MRYLDSDGEEVKEGDTIVFSYGIPPVKVTAPIVSIDGVLVAITLGHNPPSCGLRTLKHIVGGYYKEIEDEK